jgi:flagella basal body P-ring formation protein FlgA
MMIRILLCSCILLTSWPVGSHAGEVTGQGVKEALISYVRTHAPGGVEVEQWEMRRGDELPMNGRIVGLELAPGSRWQARTALRLQVEAASGKQSTLWVSTRLRYARKVVVARRNLPIGHRIGRDDVQTEVRDGWRYNRDLFEKSQEVTGTRVWRPVAKGACLKKWHVREGRNMQRGDSVRIVVQNGSVRVEAPGQLLEGANPGERVRVLNVASGREIYGTVLDRKTVLVAF